MNPAPPVKLESSWEKHIKHIPDDNYYLTLSCILGSFYPGAEIMVTKLYDMLGINWKITHEANNGWSCCSGIGFHGDIMTIEASLLTIARLWSIYQSEGMDVITPTCVTSFGMLCEAKDLMEHDEELHDKIQKILVKTTGRTFTIPEYLVHVSDIYYHFRYLLCDEFMKYRLVDKRNGRPLKVVDHVGCHYSKLFPEKHVIGGSEYCDVLAGMVRAWGGENIDYPERRHCCGMGFRQCMISPNRGGTMASTLKKMRSMAPFKPDLIITNCPGCQLFLDKMQWPICEMTGERYDIPVLTYQETSGLLMGWDPYKTVGIRFHNVPIEPLLEKIGIPFNG